MFTRIQTIRRYQQVANQIIVRIRSGELPIGSQLPPERELAIQLGVSRPTVREALIALELLGVVEIRIGQGTYVLGDVYTSLEDITRSSALAPFDLLEARTIIEVHTVTLSAERWAKSPGNTEGLHRAFAICSQMEQIVQDAKQIEEFYRLGLEFHKVVATYSANEVLENIIGHLVDATDHPLWELINRKILEDQRVRQNQLNEHMHILQAIQSGDVQASAQSMRHHLTHLADLTLS